MEKELFKNNYRIPSIRLKGFDYGQNASYFVTICTKDREDYFGKIEASLPDKNWTQNFIHHDFIEQTEIGTIALAFWKAIPLHNPFVKLDTFVVMPNHIHGILIFDKSETHNNKSSLRENIVRPFIDTPFAKFESLTCINKFDPQSKNLSSVLRGYKAAVKTEALKKNIDFYWQPRFHDRIIRDQNEYERIKNYILNNPSNWNTDTDNLVMYKR